MNEDNERERQLNADWDGDGLTTREELMYGFNPYAADTDGDGVLDSQEGVVSSSVEPKTEQDELRDRYLTHAQTILDRPNLEYEDLCREIGDDRWLAQGIDQAVLSAELSQGQSLEQASLLLAKSPFVRFMQKQGQLHSHEVQNYLKSVVERQRERVPQIIQVASQ